MNENMPDLSHIFHDASKIRHDHGATEFGSAPETWPEEWLTTYYKSYPRLPKIPLTNAPPRADFFSLVDQRHSSHNFTGSAVTLHELSILLRYSCGITGRLDEKRFRRAQPSGGARFPIEVYPLILTSTAELPAGVYHYNVKDHALDVLWQREFSETDVGALFTYPWVARAACVLVLTSVFWRNQNKYGQRGYRYILIEAGHIGQGMYLATEALGLTCCAMGGIVDEAMEKLLDLDGVAESVVYGLVVGK